MWSSTIDTETVQFFPRVTCVYLICIAFNSGVLKILKGRKTNANANASASASAGIMCMVNKHE